MQGIPSLPSSFHCLYEKNHPLSHSCNAHSGSPSAGGAKNFLHNLFGGSKSKSYASINALPPPHDAVAHVIATIRMFSF